jgi:hypothetical protein
LEWIKALPKNLIIREQGAMHIPNAGAYVAQVYHNSIYVLQYSDFDGNKDYDIHNVSKISKSENANVALYKVALDGSYSYSSFSKKINIQPDFPGSRNFNNYILHLINNTGVVYFNSKGTEHYGRFKLN